ncbi:hypothetical protein PTNB29_03380 [Pyrenophora teres f. teres]|nr:hypothetical protein PTNB29_03380 [Pyrenophora teres f. teres]
MASPSQHKSLPFESAAPSSSSTEEPHHSFTRTVSGFGDRLAHARNQEHTEVNRASVGPARTATGSISAEVAPSVRGLAPMLPGALRYGWEIGPYRSLFQFNQGQFNQDISSEGMNRFANWSSSFASPPTGFPSSTPAYYTPVAPDITAYTPQTNIHSTLSAQTLPEDIPITSPICRTVTPGPDAKERLLLLGPLRMIRNTGKRLSKNEQALLYTFLDMHMADELHTVVDRDIHLPHVVYKVSIPMTDLNWAKYNQVLAVFGFPNAVHEMLAQGAQSFDHYTYVIDGTVDWAHAQAWAIMVSRLKGVDIDRLANEIMEVWGRMWTSR